MHLIVVIVFIMNLIRKVVQHADDLFLGVGSTFRAKTSVVKIKRYVILAENNSLRRRSRTLSNRILVIQSSRNTNLASSLDLRSQNNRFEPISVDMILIGII